MRELILDRIREFVKMTGNFNLSVMRWQNAKVKGFPLCLVKFDELSDTELLDVYEVILRQYNKQM